MNTVIMQGVTIRQATFEDANDIAKLDLSIFPFLETKDVAEFSEIVRAYIVYQKSFVAVLNSEIVGYVVTKFETVLDISATKIISFGVTERLRNQGIGRLLLEMLIAVCIGNGDDMIMLYTNVENRSVRLYHSLGFRVSKMCPDYYEDSDLWLGDSSRNAYFMSKVFGDRTLLYEKIDSLLRVEDK